MEDLCNANKDSLRHIWGGIEGERMYEELRGKIVYHPPTHRSTIGHSHVLPPKLKNNDSAYAVLHRLLQKAAMRLRYLGYYAGALGIVVRYKADNNSYATIDDSNYKNINKYGHVYRRQKSLKWKDHLTFTHTQNTIEFIRAFDMMWARNPFLTEDHFGYTKKNIPTAVAVVLFNLLHMDYTTPSFFENHEKNRSLYKAIDLLNKRYGYSSIYFGGSHIARDSAPMRIAFTQIPNLEIEDDYKA